MNSLFLLLTWTCLSMWPAHLATHRLVGKPAPRFELTAIDGQVVSTVTPGEVTIISFWFVGCPPSMAQIPLINRLAEAYPQVNVIGITPHIPSAISAYCDSSDHSHRFAAFREAYHLPIPSFPVVAACTQSPYVGTNVIGPDCKRISKDFKTKGYPRVFFVDKSGVVRAVKDGFYAQPTAAQMATETETYRAQIETLLAE